jgi:3D (Asp-Asp-Asp) domain-containing protein
MQVGVVVMKKMRKRTYISVISVTVAAIAMFAVPSASVAESDTVPNNQPPSSQETQASPVKSDVSKTKAKAPDYKAKAKADGKSHIKISWSKVKDADGYTVYRSDKKDKLGKKIHTVKNASKKSYKDKKAAVNKKYWYTVKAWKKVDGKKLTIAVIKAKKVKNSLKYSSLLKVKTYAYSGGGTTASGKKAQVGRVAVDPRVIELGTWLYIEDYGLCQAADTGGAIKGNKIDLYMNSESECYEWGIRHKKVYILE